MFRLRLKTAAALAGLGLFCGCASTNSANSCGEPRQGFFSRMFAGWNRPHGTPCECIETGRVSDGDGPIVPDPGCCSGCGAPGLLPQGYVPQGFAPQGFAPQGFAPQGVPFSTPTVPPMPPPTALPLPGSAPLAQPVPANPSSATKDATK